MKSKSLILIGVLSALPVTAVGQPNANFPALFWQARRTRLPPNMCASRAQETVRSVGLQNQGQDPTGAGGTTATTRAFITCVPLPRFGPCPGTDGAAVYFVAASSLSADDALGVIRQLSDTFGDPILFDCN